MAALPHGESRIWLGLVSHGETETCTCSAIFNIFRPFFGIFRLVLAVQSFFWPFNAVFGRFSGVFGSFFLPRTGEYLSVYMYSDYLGVWIILSLSSS